MEKQDLKMVFSKLTEDPAWTLQVVRIKVSKDDDIVYVCREVEIDPNDKLLEYIDNISKHYISQDGLEKYSSIDDYTGDIIGDCIYRLDNNNELIKKSYNILIQAVANPDREANIKDMGKFNAAIFKGNVEIDNTVSQVMLISLQKPITTFTNKFVFGIETNKFKLLKEPILTLRSTIDVAVIGNTVYLFTMEGEKLFDLNRTYKAICKAKVNEISQYDFITDKDSFISIANSGRNPRRFISFNNSHFEALTDEKLRKKLGKKLSIKLKKNKIDTTDPENVERLVKFLCNKAMIDPCDESPMEVAAAKPWR